MPGHRGGRDGSTASGSHNRRERNEGKRRTVSGSVGKQPSAENALRSTDKIRIDHPSSKDWRAAVVAPTGLDGRKKRLDVILAA